MMIRNSKIEDAQSIIALSLDLTIDRTSKWLSGFVEYPTPTKNELIRRIQDNPFFYVAEEGGKIIAFLSAYKSELLKKLDFSNDEIVRHILKKPFPLIYFDLLAVAKSHQNKKIAKQLIERFLMDSKGNKIYGPIAHEPHKNNISIKLLTDFGFRLIEEINVYDGLIFGIYYR